MSKEIVDLLADCLEINDKKGAAPLDYRQQAGERSAELEELVRLAETLKASPQVTPTAHFRAQARRRLLARLPERAAQPSRLREALTALHQLSALFAYKRRFSLAPLLLLAITTVLLLSVGVVHASASSLPADTLYPVKTTLEEMQLALAPNKIRYGELHLKFAGRRLEEIGILSQYGPGEAIPMTVAYYVNHIEAVQTVVTETPGATDLAETFNHVSSQQEIVLAHLQQSTGATVGVDEALIAVARGRSVARGVMLGRARQPAAQAQLRLQFATDRLAAANTFAAIGQVELADLALIDYSLQVEAAVYLVGQADQDHRQELAGLMAQTLTNHETVLAQVGTRVPNHSQLALQHAREVSAHGRAVVEAVKQGASPPPRQQPGRPENRPGNAPANPGHRPVTPEPPGSRKIIILGEA
jgi:hypothetical protein